MRRLGAAAAAGLTALAAAQDGAAPNLAVSVPPAAEVSVDDALEGGAAFLVANQNADGSFGHHTSGRSYEILADVPGSHQAFKVATTALCWMALRDLPVQSDQTEAAARRALGWLVEHVRVKRANPTEMYNVWAFGYGLRALAQALRTEAPGADPEAMREAAGAIVKALSLYRVPDGGWGYYDFNARTYRPSGASMSFTTATILIALVEAEHAGIEVDDGLVAPAVRNLRACRKADGSYLYGYYLRYRPHMPVNQRQGSAMRTPVCNLALRLYGADVTDEDLRQGVEDVMTYHRFAVAGVRRPIPHESWFQVSGYFYLYGHQYAALCLELLDDADRARWWPPLTEAVLKARQPDGSFWDYPLYGYHKFYGTAYALIALARAPDAPIGEEEGAEAPRH